MFTSLSKKNLIIYLFFAFYFFLGILCFKHYGFAFDEDIQREIGESNLKYIINYFGISPISSAEILYPHYGVSFEALALIVEKIFQIQDIHNQYLLRHFLIFLFSFVGVFFFFLLLLKRYRSIILSLIGCLLLIISPRFFAESFYNSKDIVFMYAFIISFYFSLLFLENPKIKNIIFFTLACAFLINIRVIGVILPLLVTIIFFIKYLRSDYKKFILYLFSYLFFLITFTILMWPSLWSHPIDGFINAFFIFKSYNIEIYNYYLGNYINAKNIHWYYIPLWIFITIPPFILLLFTLGIVSLIKRVLRRLFVINNNYENKDLWRGGSELIDLISILSIVLPIGLTILLNSTLYNGWRHLYFVYPFLVLISINPIYRLKMISQKLQRLSYLAIVIFSLYYAYWNFKFHPFQYSYFNIFSGQKAHLNFDVDYWGLSNKYALEYIIQNNKNNNKKINVSNLSDTNLILNIKLLEKEKRAKINYVGEVMKSDFLIDNNIFFKPSNRKRREILEHFDVFHQLIIDNVLITSIYRKKL